MYNVFYVYIHMYVYMYYVYGCVCTCVCTYTYIACLKNICKCSVFQTKRKRLVLIVNLFVLMRLFCHVHAQDALFLQVIFYKRAL